MPPTSTGHHPFAELQGFEVTDDVRRGLEGDGITSPTAVQRSAIPLVIEGRHVVIHSGTGTGKTLAYLLPILQHLRLNPRSRAVVLAPSPELAVQILAVADAYKAPSIGILALPSSGSFDRQKEKLKKRPRLMVGTSGRILELYSLRKLKGVNVVVIDEPDPILSAPNEEYFREILSRPDPKVQVIMAGATLGPRAETFAQEVMRGGFVRTAHEEDPLRTHISHGFVALRAGDAKDVHLARLFEQRHMRRAVVFVNSERTLRHLYRYLHAHGLEPVSLSVDRPKAHRKKAVESFKAGAARVLITTDDTCRGLDLPDLEWVVHYDLPRSAQGYVHRSGRTARAGKEGYSIALVSPQERALLKRLARELKLDLQRFFMAGRKTSPSL